MDDVRLLEVLDEAVRAVRGALDVLEDWGPSGGKPGQYRLDLAADGAALPVLHGAGLTVLSEESGTTGDGGSGLLAVIDPIDGSTNAHRGVPFYSTSICVLDAEGPRVGVVTNQATGVALRRGAGRRGGEGRAGHRAFGVRGSRRRHCGDLGVSRRAPGLGAVPGPRRRLPRVLRGRRGRTGRLSRGRASTLYSWDYLAGLLICREVGAAEGEREGRDLIVREASSRRPVVAATRPLADRLLGEKAL